MTGECPKCAHPIDAESCPKCGLVFALFDESIMDGDVPHAIKDLWDHVMAGWDDKGRHALFIEQSIATGSVGYAAARYRSKRGDPVADAQLEHLSNRLIQNLNAAATGKSSSHKGPANVVLMIVMLLAAMGVAWFAVSTMR